ncbi:hypothetical protein [Paludisphaera mucosa]|uniref:Uncharacterized protein n=1 Tax=Paludisphaera mucosa TaxID=3030827 RepID=A0ABT6FLU9_9BACT|nr:hypothetical protein [Paludisphaera mucosa]MDG3008514.1 hypothetical protein [Paludisphaera mucosa]
MVRSNSPLDNDDKPALLTAAAIVDRLVGIRDELANGVKPAFVVPSIWSLIGDIERTADAATEAAMDALRDRLAERMPPVSGGAPDDELEFDPVLAYGWPAWTDNHFWAPTFDGPTPDEVLEAEEPFDASFAAWVDRCDAIADAAGRYSEEDARIAMGC